jgi:hypothetical protein
MSQTQKQQLKIGQIIYVLSNKGQEIIPAMVIEEQTIQTLQGVNVSWKIAIGSGEKQKIVDSTKLNAELYSSLEEVKSLLSTRLNKFIDGLVVTAQKRETAWYGHLQKNKNQIENNTLPNKTSKIDPESLLDGMDIDNNDFDIEDSKQNQNVINFSGFVEKDKAMSAKEKLRESIMPSEDELRRGIDDNKSNDNYDTGMVITDPSGRPMRVNLKV